MGSADDVFEKLQSYFKTWHKFLRDSVNGRSRLDGCCFWVIMELKEDLENKGCRIGRGHARKGLKATANSEDNMRILEA